MSSTGEAVFFHTVDESWKLGWNEDGGGVKDEKGKVWAGKDIKDRYVIMDPEGMDMETDDLLKLSELHEGALLRCVRKRHAEDQIYTFIGPSVVLSLNPWKFTIPQYMDDKMDLYINNQANNPPHVWSVGKSSYDNMLESGQCQTILVSGESGAGKTEAVKSLLKFLGALSKSKTALAASSASSAPQDMQLQAKIEACNPILETFGNAKTVRNDNSSRFGKFLKVAYDTDGQIVGARTINYLLERSRVIGCGKQERSFHSFYQLLASSEAASAYSLDAPTMYPNCGSDYKIDGVDDKACYEETCEAMDVMGFSPDEKKATWSLVAGILHLQRVKFEEDADDTTVVAESTKQFLTKCSDCWSVSPEELEKQLLQVTVKAGSELVTRKHSVAKSASVRDAVCKEIYASLFQWIVNKINVTMEPDDSEATWIGLLDIFGFEHFQHNSLEQLCINLANEMLQNHYNEHIFTADLLECAAEGIETTHVKFQDNTAMVDMIASSSSGILAHLDDQCKTRPEDDDAFLERITQQFEKSSSFYRSKLDRDAFRLMHYAAEVRYSVKNFGEKNLDSVQDSLLSLVKNSQNEVVVAILQQDRDTSKSGADSVTAIFKRQLKELLTMINSTKPSWIRCIKPHPVKRPKLFDPVSTMAQLASSGVLETVRVRKSGYPVRLPHAVFVNRFKVLLPSVQKKKFQEGALSAPEAARIILQKLNLGMEKAQIGKTKVFLRTFAHTEIEEIRTNAFAEHAHQIIAWGRTALAMQDLFDKRHKGLLLLLKAQHVERKEFEAKCLEERTAIDEEQLSCFAGIMEEAIESEKAALSGWCAALAKKIEDEADAAHLEFCELFENLNEDYESQKRARFENDHIVDRGLIEVQEDEAFERFCILSEEVVSVVEELMQEKDRIDAEQEEEERRLVLIIERRQRRVLHLEEEEACARIILLSEEDNLHYTELSSEYTSIKSSLHAEEQRGVTTTELNIRSNISLQEEEERCYLGFMFEEMASTVEIAEFGRFFWGKIHDNECAEVEEEEEIKRERIEEEEREEVGDFEEQFRASHQRAHAMQCDRELSEFQTMEHINRLRIEAERDAMLPYLCNEKARIHTRLIGQFMNDCVLEEQDRRADIIDHYNAFWGAIEIAWDQAFEQVQIAEIDGELWENRRALEGVWEESRSQLETVCLQDQTRVASIDRAKELEMVHAKLDALVYESASVLGGRGGAAGTTTRSPSPLPFRHGSYSPRVDYVQNHSVPTASPPRSMSGMMGGAVMEGASDGAGGGVVVEQKRNSASLRSVSAATHCPFRDGTWLWRAAVPSVGKRWTRVFVKLYDGELKWYHSESSPPKVFKLHNVINIESHQLPDRSGYKHPAEHSPSIAGRYSSACQHAGMRLQLKGEVEGAAGKVAKSMLLCAEFPSVAVMWLRRLRQEWSTVCDEKVHPHGRKGANCIPGKGSIDLAPVLAACPDNPEARELVRDLRKWMRKAKRAGLEVSSSVDLRQYNGLPEASLAATSPRHRGAPREPSFSPHRSHSPVANTVAAYSQHSPTPMPYGLGKHNSTHHVDTHCTATGCAHSRRSVSRPCEGGGGNVYSAPRILGLTRDKGRIVGQIAIASEGQDEPEREVGDNDSDLSEDIPFEDRVNMAIAERDLVERPIDAVRRAGREMLEAWREAWRQTFGQKRRVRRRDLVAVLHSGKENAVRREIGKANIYTTAATITGIDTFLKRVFHDCGDPYIEEDDFVTWCASGGEDLTACRLIHAQYSARVVAPVAGVALLAFLSVMNGQHPAVLPPSPLPIQQHIPAPSPPPYTAPTHTPITPPPVATPTPTPAPTPVVETPVKSVASPVVSQALEERPLAASHAIEVSEGERAPVAAPPPSAVPAAPIVPAAVPVSALMSTPITPPVAEAVVDDPWECEECYIANNGGQDCEQCGAGRT